MIKKILSAGLCCIALNAAAQAPASTQAVIAAMWAKAPEDFAGRIVQDETQALCTQTRNAPSPAQSEAIVAREQTTIIYPADGQVTGDWKRGEKIAQSGAGGQFSDSAATAHGGNCYACHQMDPRELSYGTLGPSLAGYGRNRQSDAAAAKAAFAKIFNSQSVNACSGMPRFGANKFLDEQQIKDVTAYLMDRDSPVNQ